MDRNESIKAEVDRIISEYRTRAPRAARKQYPASKAQIARLAELGLLDYMPAAPYSKAIGYTEAELVIKAAETGPSAVFNAYGEGEATGPSALWRALNETDAAEDEAAYTVALDGDGGHQTQAGASGASGMAYAAGSEIVVFKTAGGWMSCIRGVSVGGNAYETDDFGPFGTAAEAEVYARDYAAAYNE